MAHKPNTTEPHPAPKKRRRRWPRNILFTLLMLAFLLTAARLALPVWVRDYVNRTIDQHPLYDGIIGDVDMKILKGGYVIHNIRINKTTGNVPVPFFSAKRLDLHLEWEGILARKLVGKVVMIEPEINFVDSGDVSSDQTGAEGSADPWLQIIRDLFPFKINSVEVVRGAIHFRAFDTKPPVDIYLSNLHGNIKNLTNIHDAITPLITTVDAQGNAMDQAKFEFNMKLDPFSYRPTFQLAVRLLGLDVTQINTLAKAYGQFDFERGYFDLVVELKASEGRLEGYVKPLFRNVQILSLKQDLAHNNPLEIFWEALIGITTEVLKNPPRNQIGTLVPLEGDLSGPRINVLTIIGNVLRNAFIRAYLPRFEGTNPDVDFLKFKPATINEPLSIGSEK